MDFIDLTIKNLVRKMNVNKKKYKVISIFQKKPILPILEQTEVY